MVCPEVIAPMLQNTRFGERWFGIIPHIRDPEEKESTCKGLYAVVRALPALCQTAGPMCALGYSLLSWQNYDEAGGQPPAELLALAKEMVQLHKQAHAAQAQQFFSSLPHDVQGALQYYQLG